MKGTGNATTANVNGEFELNNVNEKATLLITGVSIERQEVKVEGKKWLSITAKTSMEKMEEVIVRKGYYDEKKTLTTGNVDTDNS